MLRRARFWARSAIIAALLFGLGRHSAPKTPRMPVAEHQSLKDLIHPHPRQFEFLKASDVHRRTLYGGARGGGKSYIERWRHVRFLLRLTRMGLYGVQTGIFCNTYRDARSRQFLKCEAEFPDWLGTSNESNLEFNFWPAYGGHRILFGNLKDVSQYKSEEFATMGIEELTLCPDPIGTIEQLNGSLRFPGVAWTPMAFTTNPDGPGHSQVKAMFVTKSLFKHPDHARKNPDDYAFIRALPTDNPSLPDDYVEKELGELAESLRKPWLEGSWDLFEGQRFEFNPRAHILKAEEHLLRNFEPFRAYRSIDYGFYDPYACGWYIVYEDEHGRKRKLKIREDVRAGLKAHQQIDRVHRITEELGLEGRIESTYLDTACWAQEKDGLSIADKFIQGGIPVVQVLKDRAAGWVALESALSYEIGKDGEIVRYPQLQFFDCCVLTTQQITDANWDLSTPGDILHPQTFRDDALDETRYFVMTHAAPPAAMKDEGSFAFDKKVWQAMQRRRS